MSRMRIVALVIGGLALVAAAAVGVLWIQAGSGEPSAAVVAPPVAPPSTDTSYPAPAGSETTTSLAGSSEGEGSPTPILHRINPAASTVAFEVDEKLRGSPFRVVGTTSEVAGEMLVDFDVPSAVQLGTVVINVRTLTTDSSIRDRAMRGPILGSSRDENEFATFEPTQIEGLPAQVSPGDRIALRITGLFTLSGVTHPLTFNTEVAVLGEERLQITGTASLRRSDFGLTIPEVPGVTDVSDEVLLVLNLVTEAAES